jgi:hypothetical protein
MMRAAKHQMFDNRVLASLERRQSLAKLGGAEIREEAQSSEIHADDRQLALSQLSTAAEDTAITAEHHNHVGVEIFRDLFVTGEDADDFDIADTVQIQSKIGPCRQDVCSIAAREDNDFQVAIFHVDDSAGT